MSAYCDEPEALRNLCINCPYDRCTSADRGCAEYRKAEACTREGKPYAMPDDWKPGARSGKAAKICLDAAFEKLKQASPPALMLEAEPPEPQMPKAVPAQSKPEPSVLALYNSAIKALRALWAAEPSADGLSAVPVAIAQLIRARAERFESLVDWESIEKQQGGMLE